MVYGDPRASPRERPNECEFKGVCGCKSGFVGCFSFPSYRGTCQLFIELSVKKHRKEKELKND